MARQDEVELKMDNMDQVLILSYLPVAHGRPS